MISSLLPTCSPVVCRWARTSSAPRAACHRELQTFDLQCIHEVATHFTAFKNAGSEMNFTRLFVVASTTVYIYSLSYMTRVMTSKDCRCEERRRKRREEGKSRKRRKKDRKKTIRQTVYLYKRQVLVGDHFLKSLSDCRQLKKLSYFFNIRFIH
jgi:hypothetical protein